MASIFLFPAGLGGPEVALIVVVIFLLFSAKRIPELAQGIGQGIREFKQATKEIFRETGSSAKE